LPGVAGNLGGQLWQVVVALQVALVEGLLQDTVQVLVKDAEQGAHELVGVLLFVASEMGVFGAD